MTWADQVTVAFDVDLGELVEGRHIIARGLEFGETGAILHYQFAPGLEAGRPIIERADLQHWKIHTEDDAGTRYSDPGGGAFAGSGGPQPSHGVRDLGGHTPRAATRLTLWFEPGSEWTPPDGYVRRLDVDLRTGEVTVPARH